MLIICIKREKLCSSCKWAIIIHLNVKRGERLNDWYYQLMLNTICYIYLICKVDLRILTIAFITRSSHHVWKEIHSLLQSVAWSVRTFAKFRKCTQLFFARFCHICYLVSQVFTAKMSWVRHLILKGGGANNFCQKRQSCKSNNRATRWTFVDKKPSCLRSCTFYRNLGNAASHW